MNTLLRSWLSRYPTQAAVLILAAGACVGVADGLTGAHIGLPIFNVEFLLLLLIPHAGACLCALLVGIEITAMIGQIYGIRELVFSVPELWRNAPYFPWPLQVALAFGVLVLIVLGWGGSRLARRSGSAALMMTLAAVLILARVLEPATGINLLGTAGRDIWNHDRWTLKYLWASDSAADFSVVQPEAPIEKAIENALVRRQHVLYILVESLGLARDAVVQDEVDRLLSSQQVLEKYRVEKGGRAFSGSTVHGELRDLCNLKLLNLFFDTVPGRCLPQRLAESGYKTRAFHGNDARFYRRNLWYPWIGFQSVSDIRTLSANGHSYCGGLWNGYCDLDLLEQLPATGAHPHFDYVLTLNTHSPIEPMTRGDGRLQKCESRELPEVCSHLSNLARVLRSIEALLLKRRDTVVIVSGDHAPRFHRQEEVARFDPERTPYYVFSPR